MPSRLRESISFEEGSTAINTIRASVSPPPSKKQKMSLSQTYFIASSARAKLGKEAMRSDHNLRLLVGHANLLDALMIELRDAEREQEAWFNASVKHNQRAEQPRHVQWIDTVAQDDDSESDSDSDSEFDEEDFEMAMPLRRVRSPPVTISSREVDDDFEDDSEDEEEMGYTDFEDTPELALTRTSSHPPELVDDSDSEDDATPPTTPPQAVLEFSELDITMAKKTQSTHFNHLISQRDTPMIEAY